MTVCVWDPQGHNFSSHAFSVERNVLQRERKNGFKCKMVARWWCSLAVNPSSQNIPNNYHSKVIWLVSDCWTSYPIDIKLLIPYHYLAFNPKTTNWQFAIIGKLANPSFSIYIYLYIVTGMANNSLLIFDFGGCYISMILWSVLCQSIYYVYI